MIEHIQAETYHVRRGGVKNAFRYGVDFVLTNFCDDGPALLSHNRFNLWSLWDHKHGGPRGDGKGLDWFLRALTDRGYPLDGSEFYLLTQPSFLGIHFNPVSFWIAVRDGQPCAFIAEVNNTFGDRHCYFCAHPDFKPINKHETILAEKLMHVSPFQKVKGQYHFVFEMSENTIDIRISYENGNQGVLATLNGSRKPATSRSLLWAAIRRPLGAARVVSLIYLQALILYIKRAPFVRKPKPPAIPISDSTNFAKKST